MEVRYCLETITLIALVCDDHDVMRPSEPVARRAVEMCWRMGINSGVSGWSVAAGGVIDLAATNANIPWTSLIGDDEGDISIVHGVEHGWGKRFTPEWVLPKLERI